MATIGQQTDLVVSQIEGRTDQSNDLLAQTKTAIDDTRDALDVAISALASNAVSIVTTGVNTTFSPATATPPTIPSAPAAPTVPALPTAPVIPAADSIAISQALWDAAFTRSQGLQDRIGVKNAALASNRAAWNGHSEWDETEAALLAEATDKADAETSKNALESAWLEAQALRQDVIALAPLGIQSYAAQSTAQIANYTAVSAEDRQRYVSNWKLALDEYQQRWATKTASEQARLGFERLELDKVTNPERVRAEYDLKKTEMAQFNAVGQLGDLAQILAQVTASLVTGSDVNLSSGVSLSNRPVVYNPSEGDVVQTPL